MNIVITNVYCYQNKGDAGIVLSMIEQFTQTFNNPQITVVSLYPDLDRGKYHGVNVISAPILPQQNTNKLFRLVSTVKSYISMLLRIYSGRYNGFENAMNKADIIISCGGGYMKCRSFRHFFGDFIVHYAQPMAAIKLKKDYVIFAQTIGPFGKSVARFAEPLLYEAKMVLAREEISYNYVKNTYPNAKVYLTGDIAFLLKKEKVDFKVESNYINVGITVRDWNFPECIDAEERRNNYINAIVEFLDKRAYDKKFRFYLMPQVIGPHNDNDIIVSKKIQEKALEKDNIFLVMSDYQPGAIKQIYSQMDYFIGTRMHSNIFALSSNVPCIAISYDYKTDGIMKMIHKEEYVISITEITVEKLDCMFDRLCKDNNYRNDLKRIMPTIMQKAKLNIEYITPLLRK